MGTRVDIEGMNSTLSDMLSNINALKGHIDDYNPDASVSLGESSFRPTIEGNLQKIKDSYLEMVPKLEEIQKKIDEIKEEYITRAMAVSN